MSSRLLIGLVAVTMVSPLLVNQLYAYSSDQWNKTVQRVKPAIVSIRGYRPVWSRREKASSYEATGFLVDSRRGIILSNRHVVGASPNVARAVFTNRDEVELRQLYVDPTHDFGFFQFDPSSVRFSLVEVPLGDSDLLMPGEEIRVLGNNAGLDLSILAGTVSRTKRNPPFYGLATYNDQNIFYIQTSADTSGGSSGGPVINIRGEVVALNAGGISGASAAFELPINAPKRALRLLQNGLPIHRGTMGIRLFYASFRMLEMLGVPQSSLKKVREDGPTLDGMIVVDDTLPGLEAHDLIEPGDVLVDVEGTPIRDNYEELEEILDRSIGKSVAIRLWRGGRSFSLSLAVHDLADFEIEEIVTVGAATFHKVPIELVYDNNVPIQGVYCAQAFLMMLREGINPNIIITKLAGEPIETVSEFVAMMRRLSNGQTVRLDYLDLNERNQLKIGSFQIEKNWFPLVRHLKKRESARWSVLLQ